VLPKIIMFVLDFSNVSKLHSFPSQIPYPKYDQPHPKLIFSIINFIYC